MSVTPKPNPALSPIFFQLRRQRTATRRLPGQVKHFRHLRPGSHAEPWPIHCRVGQRLFGVEQKAVFDKQQAADHYRRNRCKIRIQLLRIVVLVQRRGAARQSVIDNPAWIFSEKGTNRPLSV